MGVADWPHGLLFSGWGVLLGSLLDGFLGTSQVNRCVRWREAVGWQNKREGWKRRSWGWGRVDLVTWPPWEEVAMGGTFLGLASSGFVCRTPARLFSRCPT